MADMVFTPYSSVTGLIGNLQTGWIPPADQERINSYGVYEQIYWNEPRTFKLVTRDMTSDEESVYVPSGKIIVETVNRYVGANMTFQVDPMAGSPASRQLALETFTDLFKRERFYSKYNTNKRFGLIRGDSVWHVFANPAKDQGRRLSIVPVDPASYFPVFEDQVVDGGDPDKMVKVHLAERVVVGDKIFVKRLTYEYGQDGKSIWSSVALFDEKKWFLLGGDPTTILQPLTQLPPDITAFPVYHTPNFANTSGFWGSSELRGLPGLIRSLNQSISDEDFALALEGLGVYATDQAGGPVDKDGNETDWYVYPGRVIENAKGLKRIQGIGSVQPYTDHIGRLEGYLREGSGASDAAIGSVDVSVAESGIALLLRLGPMLAKAAEQDQVIVDTHQQMFYDLRFWLKAYEGLNILDTFVIPKMGPKLPINIDAEIERVSKMMLTSPPLLSAQTGREYLQNAGVFQFAQDEAARVSAEQAQQALDQAPVDQVNALVGDGGAADTPVADGSAPQPDVAASE